MGATRAPSVEGDVASGLVARVLRAARHVIQELSGWLGSTPTTRRQRRDGRMRARRENVHTNLLEHLREHSVTF